MATQPNDRPAGEGGDPPTGGADAVKRTAETAAEGVSGLVHKATDAAGEAGKAVKQWAGDAYDATAEGVHRAYDATAKGVRQAAHAVGDGTHNAEELIRKYPIQSVLIGVSLGLLVGAAVRA